MNIDYFYSSVNNVFEFLTLIGCLGFYTVSAKFQPYNGRIFYRINSAVTRQKYAKLQYCQI